MCVGVRGVCSYLRVRARRVFVLTRVCVRACVRACVHLPITQRNRYAVVVSSHTLIKPSDNLRVPEYTRHDRFEINEERGRNKTVLEKKGEKRFTKFSLLFFSYFSIANGQNQAAQE